MLFSNCDTIMCDIRSGVHALSRRSVVIKGIENY